MGATNRSKRTEEDEPRALRKRSSVTNYADEDAILDALLGTEENSKNIRLKKPDIPSLRRKLERTCPATPLTNFVTPTAVVPALVAEGFRRPLVVRANANGHVDATRAALGLHLPLACLSPKGLIKGVGGDHEVPTFDVATQDSGPRMTVKQLADYFALSPEKRTRLFNVVSFSLADTDLADKVDPPEATRHLDLSSQVWPEDDDPRPETLLYALLGPKGAYTDWHIDMGGSSVWYHLISGCKIFMLAPNTPQNNATFEKWSTSEQQTSAFLGDSLEHCQRVVLHAGDTLFLPSGWPHAVSTPEDSFVLGGNFLSSLDYGSIAHVYRSEIRLGVQPKFQFPLFRRLMWHAARCAVNKIKEAKKAIEQEEKKKKKVMPISASVPLASKKEKQTTNGTSPTSAQRSKDTASNKATTSLSLPTTSVLVVPQLNTWERHGLPSLLSLLKDWQQEPSSARRVDIPDEINDADAFLEEMEQLIQEIDAGGASNSNDRGAAGSGEPHGSSIKAKRFVIVGIRRQSRKSNEPKPSESDCGTSSSEDEDDEEEDEDNVQTERGLHGLNPIDRRRPEKRTKQLASLVQLKEALAARASKPKNAYLHPSPQYPRTNGANDTNTTSMNKTKISRGIESTSAAVHKATVITLSSSSDESDCESEPMSISSSSEEEHADDDEGNGAVRPFKKASTAAAAAAVNRGLKSLAMPARRKQQQEKKVSEAVYMPPVALDVQPLGRTKQPQQPLSKRKHINITAAAAGAATNGAAQDPSPSSERVVALRQISEMRKLEQDLEREQRLLKTVVGGGVALKDSGQKLQDRVSARRQQLDMMKNILEGKVLSYTDGTGQRQGPFTSRQLGVLVKAGTCPEGAVVERTDGYRGGTGVDTSLLKDKKSSYLTIEEAIALPVPLTAVVLKEESDCQAKEIKTREEAGQAIAGMQHQQQRQQEGEYQDKGEVQKKKRSKNRSRPRKEYNEPYFSHHNKSDTPQQQRQHRPRSSQHQQHRAGPSAWDIAAATTASITQQESEPIWTFKIPQTGEYKGPYSTIELRVMYLSGELVEDIMVHDEDGGVSTSLLTLLGLPRGSSGGSGGGGSGRYEIEPYRVAAEHNQRLPQHREETWGRCEDDVKIEKSGAVANASVGSGSIKEDKVEPEPYAVTVGRQFALSAPSVAPQLQSAQPPPARQWGSYAQPQPQPASAPAPQHNGHASYYQYDRYPPPAAQHAQQAPSYYQGTASGSWAAPLQQHQQHQHQQQRPPQQHVPMANAPRPMMREVEAGLYPGPAGGWGRSAVVLPGEGGGLGPMRPAAELNQYHNHTQQQPYVNPPPHNSNRYWTSRY